jgi:hypothetical protein
MSPTAGRDYPRSYAQLRGWFDEDWKCRDYLDWLRWPDGFVCHRCGGDHGWRAPDLRWRCASCDRRVSVTAGTIFDKTRTPLTARPSHQLGQRVPKSSAHLAALVGNRARCAHLAQNTSPLRATTRPSGLTAKAV